MTKLFEPTKIGKYELQHRVVLGPLTRLRATNKGVPTDMMVEHYKQRTSPGGFLIAEATAVSPTACVYREAPGVFSAEQINAWKKVTDAVHEKDGVFFLQLWHAGRVGSSTIYPNNEPVVSASALPVDGKHAYGHDYQVPKPLDVAGIKKIVQEFRQAAINAIEAGFDGIEVHCANGYLLDQFMNSCSNHRTDDYGGSPENRSRFALEVVDAVVDAIGAERTGIRFSPGMFLNRLRDDTPVETWSYVTSALQKNHPDLAYVHFIEPRSSFNNDDVNKSDTLEPFRSIWKGPFITGGGFSNTIEQGIKLAEDTGDLIAFGRAFIANPDLPERIKRGLTLNKYDRKTFYTNDAVGYTDYPFYSEEVESRL